jgi:hypothetical protein
MMKRQRIWLMPADEEGLSILWVRMIHADQVEFLKWCYANGISIWRKGLPEGVVEPPDDIIAAIENHRSARLYSQTPVAMWYLMNKSDENHMLIKMRWE